ncbi:hypothetical protein CYMTET_33769, partial [Cymbomonas tetramitiformis]
MYDVQISPELIQATESLLELNKDLNSNIEEMLYMLNVKRTFGLHHQLDPLMEHKAKQYQAGFTCYDAVTVRHMRAMEHFSSVFRVGCIIVGTFLVASGDLSVATFISFYVACSGLMTVIT